MQSPADILLGMHGDTIDACDEIAGLQLSVGRRIGDDLFDPVAMLTVKLDPQIFGERKPEQIVAGKLAVMKFLQVAEFLDLMAVQATAVIVLQQRHFLGFSIGLQAGMRLAVVRGEPGRFAVFVHVEHFVHGLQQRIFGQPAVGSLCVASAVAAVDIEVGVEKEGGPGGVVIEIEQADIHVVHLRDTDTDKARTESANLRVVMGNLPIPGPAVGSPHAAKHDHQRFAGVVRKLCSRFQVRMPADDVRLSLAKHVSGQPDGNSGQQSDDSTQ